MRLDEPVLLASLAQKSASASNLLQRIAADYAPAVFANSLGAEDMVLTDLIARNGLPIEVFSLDTGRLPAETYELIEAINLRYEISVRLYFPRHELVEDYVQTHGINGFYQSVEQRKACCHVRKVEPLQRALSGKGAWITGMRAQQSATRADLPVQQTDADNGLEKFNPLADWSEQEVWAYIKTRDLPYNALHDRFFPSIGCAPCTRAISIGEDIRSGRWWWENPESKECGLHVSVTRIDQRP